MCVCISKITTGIILHSFLFSWTTEICSNDLSLGRYVVTLGSESKMQVKARVIGGFDKIVNHMFL